MTFTALTTSLYIGSNGPDIWLLYTNNASVPATTGANWTSYSTVNPKDLEIAIAKACYVDGTMDHAAGL